MKVLTKNNDESIKEEKLIDRVIKNTIEYGEHVIENRAVPDYRDGLKPVARRILWTAYQNGFKSTGPYYKSARLVGDVMGKYHPHGDASIYDALVKMVNLSVPPMAKQGNFGTINDPKKAAMRYTEVKLSKYGESCFFNPYLEKIIPMMPNYDGREKEPLYLPALMPNLLMNGTSGIGVGVTCDIPPLHIDSLLPFIEQAINGEELSSKKLAKNLKFNWKYGSHCISTQAEIINWIENSSQSLWFEPNYELNAAQRLIIITESTPGFDYEKLVDRLMGDETKGKNKGKKKYPFIASIEDECSFAKENGKAKKHSKEIIRFVVKLKNTINPEDFHDLAKKVVAEFTSYTKTATNVTYRKPDKIKFVPTNIPDLITRWANYRIRIEKAIITQIISELDKNIATKDLMLLAVDNLDIIHKAEKADEPYKYLEQHLKINNEQAHTIMGWSRISTAKISKDKIIADKQALVSDKKAQAKVLANPNSKILSDLSHGSSLLSK